MVKMQMKCSARLEAGSFLFSPSAPVTMLQMRMLVKGKGTHAHVMQNTEKRGGEGGGEVWVNGNCT